MPEQPSFILHQDVAGVSAEVEQEVEDALRDLTDVAEVRSLLQNVTRLKSGLKEVIAASTSSSSASSGINFNGHCSSSSSAQAGGNITSSSSTFPGGPTEHQAPGAASDADKSMWTEAEKRLQSRVLELQRQKADLHEHVLNLNSREHDLRLEVDAARREVYTSREGARSAGAELRWRKFLGRKKYQLYKTATGIRWADTGGARGYISLEHVSAFDFSHLPEDDVSEALWTKIEHCAGLMDQDRNAAGRNKNDGLI
ncbi:unnamed protein product [Amoebophrya sp. A25]|nr:unnamed protein product [Amoebophrya sp. A25]|eukprot:GSA25T00023442001.1